MRMRCRGAIHRVRFSLVVDKSRLDESSPYESTCAYRARSWRSTKRILKLVRMLAAFGNDDVHLARQPCQFAAARARHHDDVQVRHAAGHGGVVLQRERTAAPV